MSQEILYYYDEYQFGVEIEIIAEPRGPKSTAFQSASYETRCDILYHQLAEVMCAHGLDAQAEGRNEKYKSKHNVRRWVIMRDTSLERPTPPAYPAIAFEAVSPIFRTRANWERIIDRFWESYEAVFRMPIDSTKPGFHIHVCPSLTASESPLRYHWNQHKAIALGSVFYERFINDLLPAYRKESEYCMANTLRSRFLHNREFPEVMKLLDHAETKADLIKIMQGNDPRTWRYVLWNFENIAPKEGRPIGSESGTVEFRGGRNMRGKVRTKRWIAFTIAFIDLSQTVFCDDYNGVKDFVTLISSMPFKISDTPSFFEAIKISASTFDLTDHLPITWEEMSESH